MLEFFYHVIEYIDGEKIRCIHILSYKIAECLKWILLLHIK